MKFLDTTELIVSSGRGGDGICSFRKAAFRPKLGPDGGNGGRGGDIVFIADPNLNTLSHLRYKSRFKAENGSRGGPNNKTGRCGDNNYIPVPLGCVIYDNDTKEKLGEILTKDCKLTVARGGKHGFGNLFFMNSIRQSPRITTQGSPGEEKNIFCELKLIADVAFFGLPNAGKSTLLSSVSSAKPRIANYPFTTLTPQLGVVDIGSNSEGCSFTVADLPGIIEKASEGRGLGHKFLKHLERTVAIAYIIDASDYENCSKTFELIKNEIDKFNPTIRRIKAVIVLNKIDQFNDPRS